MGYVIAWRGLRPLRQISATVREIRPGNLAQRVRSEGLPEELQVLVSAFNDMLLRLESAFSRLTQFSADLAHELRTPLNNLRTGLEVGLGKPRTGDEYVEALGASLEDCLRLERLFDNLLFLARTEDPHRQIERECIELDAEARHICEFFEVMAAESGVLIQNDAEQPVWVSLSRSLLQRAVGSLMTDALRRTAAGGRITVRVKHDQGQAVLEVV
ncbi:MAG: HAMP domain-containing protein, partial [Planctomycetes bacterium]|nr:HAMP domain-containing protein [Planctomycetota bacterium]